VVDTKLIPAPMYAPPLEVDVAGKLSSLILPPSPAQLSPLKQTNLKLSMSSPSLIQSPKRYLTVKEMEEEEKETDDLSNSQGERSKSLYCRSSELESVNLEDF
jgi:hypothetical protein